MSRTIENRVVEMQFKNQQFENAINKSIASLAQLNDSINLLGGTKALKSLDTSVKNLDFSNINNGASLLTDRFSTLGVISMSAINSITSALTNNLLGALSNVSNKITGLFSTIKEKGVNRAMALQQARFSFQGLISASDEQLDEIQTAERIEEIMKAVNNSVADTPYSLAQAASAASVLAAAYGTSQESITKIESSLKTISGLAAQTGADYQQVSNIMTTVSSSGYMMGDELRRLETLGLGASTYLQKYFNSLDAKKIAELNAALSTKTNKRKKNQEISTSDIRDLASKRYITSDIVNEVFGVFFDNAQKANDTMKGVTENIGAALGRLGALFAEPIVANQGPLVKLLQVVKAKISEVANVLKEFKIDKNVTDIIGRLFEQAKNILEMINISDFSIFENVGNVFSNLNTALSMDNVSELTDRASFISFKVQDYINKNPLKDIYDYIEEAARDIAGLNDVNGEFIRNMDENATLNGVAVKDILAEAGRRLSAQSNAYNVARENAERSYENLEKTFNLWNYDYIQALVDSFNNLKNAFSEIGTVITDNIDIPELRDFINIIMGNDGTVSGAKSLRLIINTIAESIKNATEKFKNFVENNESFRKFVGGIGSAFTLIWRVLKAVKEIAVNAFESFKPLLASFSTLGGALGDFFSNLVSVDNETDVFGTTVSIISGIIDKFAKILILVKDNVRDFILASSGKENIGEVFTSIADKFKYFNKSAEPFVEKTQSIFEKIKNGLTTFFDFFKGIGEKIGKLPVIFSLIKQLFTGKKSDDTENITEGNALDQIEDNVDDYENAPEKIEKVTKGLDGISNAFNLLGEKVVAFLKGIKVSDEDIDKALNRLKLIADIILEIAIAIGIVIGATGVKNAATMDGLKKIIADPSNNPITSGFNAITKSLDSLTKTLKNSISPTEMIKEWKKAERMEALADIIKSIAAVILVFAISIAILVFSLVKLATIKKEALIKGGITLGIIAIVLGGIIAGIIILANAITNSTQNKSEFKLGKLTGSKTDSPMVKVLLAITAFILVFTLTMAKLTKSMISLSKIPKEDLIRGGVAFGVIAAILLAVLGVILFILYKFMSRFENSDITESEGLFGKDKLTKVIDSMSGILLSFTAAIKVMTEAVQKFSSIDKPGLERGMSAIKTISIIIGILMAEIMIFMYLLLDSQAFDSNSSGVIKSVIALAGTMVALGIVIYIISKAVAKLGEVPVNGLDKAQDVLVTIAFVLGGLALVVGVMAYLFKTDIANLIGAAAVIAILAISLAAVCAGIGYMISALGQSGFKASEITEILTTLALFFGGMIIIAAIIGGIAASTGVILAGIAVVALLIAAIGAAAFGIGAGVLLFGAGILLFAKAIETLINVFSLLDSEQVDTIIANIETFVIGFIQILLKGFLMFVKVLEDNKDAVISGIITIISFIFEALFAGIVAAFKSYINTLSRIIDILLEWIIENEERLKSLLEHVLDLVWFVLTEFFHHLFVFIGGEDGHGGVLGDLLTLLFGFLEDVLFDEEKGIIPFLTRAYYHITNWLQENAEPMADEMAATIVVVINALANAINEHGADFIDAVNNLIGSVINIIKYALGLPTDPSFEIPSGAAGGDDPKNYIQDFVKAMMPGWFVTMDMAKKIGQFVTDIKNKLVEKVNAVKDKIQEIGENFANDFIEGVKKLLQIASPSRTMAEIAAYTVEGFVEEVNDNARTALQAGAEFATAYTRGVERTLEGTNGQNVSFSDALKKKISLLYSDLQALFGDTFDNFTITPTMDLTQITEGFGSIEDMMNGNSSFDISALSGNLTDSLSATDTASGFDDANAPQTSMLDNLNTDTVVNFTQNNYSPESLSRIDIYRDTKNILSNPSAISQIVTALK